MLKVITKPLPFLIRLLEDVFFNGIFSDKSIDMNIAGLTDTMSSILTLFVLQKYIMLIVFKRS